jgi:hypothetical protein
MLQLAQALSALCLVSSMRTFRVSVVTADVAV